LGRFQALFPSAFGANANLGYTDSAVGFENKQRRIAFFALSDIRITDITAKRKFFLEVIKDFLRFHTDTPVSFSLVLTENLPPGA
jgi:hypothetical protein